MKLANKIIETHKINEGKPKLINLDKELEKKIKPVFFTGFAVQWGESKAKDGNDMFYTIQTDGVNGWFYFIAFLKNGKFIANGSAIESKTFPNMDNAQDALFKELKNL